MKPDLTLQT